LLKDINQSGDSNPSSYVAWDGILYFSAEDGVNGKELWRTDGTEAGTFMLKDINAGSASSSPSRLFQIGEQLIFFADNGVDGRELWRTDGTSDGTYLLYDTNPSASGITGSVETTLAGTKLYFTASTVDAGIRAATRDQTVTSLPRR
jgi:trimeric autotransporter adhesin